MIKLGKAALESASKTPGEYRTDYPDVTVRVGQRSMALSIRRRVNGKYQRTSIKLNPMDLPNLPSLKRLILQAQTTETDHRKREGITRVGEDMIGTSNLADQTADNYRRALKQVREIHGDTFPKDAGEILKLHRDITQAYGPYQANSVLKVLRRTVRYARAMDIAAPEWPTERLSVLKVQNPERSRDRRLTAATLPLVWNAELPEPWSRFVRAGLLTGLRRTNILNARIDGDMLDAGIGKNGDPIILPLTDSIEEAFFAPFEVTCTKPMTKHIKSATDLAVSPHDLRRTFASTATMAGLNQTVVAHLMNHRSSLNSVTAKYQGRPEDSVLKNALLDIEGVYRQLGCKK